MCQWALSNNGNLLSLCLLFNYMLVTNPVFLFLFFVGVWLHFKTHIEKK